MKEILKSKFFILSLKILIILFSFVYIFYRLKNFSFSELNFSHEKGLLIATILLMPVNLAFETLKLKYLTDRIEHVNFFRTYKAVFSGISFSLFTPNRIGEIFGRVFVFSVQNRQSAIVMSGVAALSQQIVTSLLGIISALNLMFFFDEYQNIKNFKLTLGLLAVLAVLLLIFYFYFNQISKFVVSKIKFLSKEKYLKILSLYSKTDFLKVLIISLLRYSVFCFQFYLLLLFFNVDINFFEAFTGISLMYAGLSLMPKFALTELGVRGSVSIFFIGIFSNQTGNILAASIFIWLVNIAFPALVGAFIFYKTKI